MSHFRLPPLAEAMRRSFPVLAFVLLLGACGSSEPKSAAPRPTAAREALAGSPPPLASLHSQANGLLGGGADAFKARLRTLRGHPVVVNKWASWCGPCRSEFPFFQRLSVREGRRIAFLGVDANDNDAAARRFLRQLPVSYPSYKDPNLKVSAVFNGVAAFPTTAFYDRRGGLSFLHQGAYATESKLARDIARYAR
jgi:cytochrome c biogenesis protein CcmG, thiol:disulfide interchange protein DsbE